METGYIYMIENKESGKKYIGRTVNYYKRMWSHKKSKNNLHGSYIDRSIQKHGEDNFNFKIIGEYERSELPEKEKEYIKKYNTYKGKGYNLTPGGEGVGKGKNHWWYGKQLSDETKEKISKANSGKSNGMYGIMGKDHHSYQNGKIGVKKAMKIIDKYNSGATMKKIGNAMGISAATVYKIIREKHSIIKKLNDKYKSILAEINNTPEPWHKVKVLSNDHYKKNSYNNIGTETIQNIIDDKCNGSYSNAELAEKYNTGDGLISRVVRGLHPLTELEG